MNYALLAWKHRDKALGGVVVILLGVVHLQQGQVNTLETALAAKPKIETRVRVETKTKIVQGPERIVERIIENPGGERIVERVVTREAVTTESGTDSDTKSSENPVAARIVLGGRAPRWILGATVAPVELAAPSYPNNRLKALSSVRIGHGFGGGRLDISYVYGLHGPWESRHGAEIAIRF